MKVVRRILIKIILFVLVVCASACGRLAYDAKKECTVDFAVEKYLTSLLNGENEAAYQLLRQDGSKKVSFEDFQSIAAQRKYFICADYHLNAGDEYQNNDGITCIDYDIIFVNAEDATLREEQMTFQKLEKSVYNYFDQWAVSADHCMLPEYHITVMKDSKVYYDGELLNDGNSQSETKGLFTNYTVANVLPVDAVITVQHPVFAEVEETVLPDAEGTDFTSEMELKNSTQAGCEEIAIEALRSIYSAVAKQEQSVDSELFPLCTKEVNSYLRKQKKAIKSQKEVFEQLRVGGYTANVQCNAFSEDEDAEITTELLLTYDYELLKSVTVETDEIDWEGNPVTETDTTSSEGKTTASFSFAYRDGIWQITSLELSVI